MTDVDKIIMRGMSFYGYHGVLPQEQELGQRFLVDVDMYLDLQPAGVSDDLNQTASYAKAWELVQQVVTGRSYRLIEAVAEQIADSLLKHLPIRQVWVRIKKPAAPIAGHFDYMGVEITRIKKNTI